MPTKMILALMLSLLVLPAFAQDDIDQLRLKAEQGDAEAQFNLGVMYDDGRGVPQDYIRSYQSPLSKGVSPPIVRWNGESRVDPAPSEPATRRPPPPVRLPACVH